MTSAGEVEQFVYCPHNWWLARHGVNAEGAAPQEGIATHRILGRKQLKIEREKREYRRAVAWFWRTVAFACSAVILTLEVVYLRSFEHILLLVVATGILVAGGAAMLLLGFINERRYKRHQAEAGIIPGKLAVSDLSGNGELLHDPAWDLHGRPDYVLDTKSGLVPVEVKSSRAPPHPHANHRLQLACYLRLLEVKTGHAPEYGLLNYSDGTFRVAYDDTLRAELKATLDRIAAARRDGKADRDHQHVGRCGGCARRDGCTQRLM